jgi:5'-3' exonuclease
MGIRGLLSFCSPIQKHQDILSTPASRIGIDAYCIFYAFKNDIERAEGLLRCFHAAGHTCTLVVDKRASALKQQTVKQRVEQRTAASSRASLLEEFKASAEFQELTPQQRRSIDEMIRCKQAESWHMTPALLERYKEACEHLEIDVIYAEEEADTALAQGVKEGKWDIVVSNDSDLLLLQVPQLWMISAKSLSTVTSVDLKEFYAFTGLNAQTAVELAAVAGSDIYPAVTLPIAQAVSWLRYYGSLGVIHKRFPSVVTAEIMEKLPGVYETYGIT